jgi:hypothetical protein
MQKQETVSVKIESVTPRGAISTRKPSVITMAVEHRFANRAAELYQDIQTGNDPETGLVGLKLIAIYEDGKEEPVVDLDGLRDIHDSRPTNEGE